MRQTNSQLLAGLLLLAASTHPANARNSDDTAKYRDTVSAAIQLFENTQRKDWTYRVERFENEEGDITSSIEQYGPGSKWTLVKLNGNHPTQKEQKDYQDKKAEQSRDNGKGASFSLRLRELINLESLTLVEDGPGQLRMAFDIKRLKRLGDEASGKLSGQLTFNKQQGFVEQIVITNNDNFSPMFSASIEQFKLGFSFTRIEDAVLPLETTMDMKGSFAFFTKIDETSRNSYSHYKKQPK